MNANTMTMTASATMKGFDRAVIEWQAAQGNPTAQRALADILEAGGHEDWAAFYRAKAKGDPAFTLQHFQERQIRTFVRRTGAAVEVARKFLRAEEWAIEDALYAFFRV